MPHCHDAQSLNGANAHQAAARHGKHCQLRGGLGRQFRECRSLLQRAHVRQHHNACRHTSSVTCTAIAEAAPEILERGERTVVRVVWQSNAHSMMLTPMIHVQRRWQQ